MKTKLAINGFGRIGRRTLMALLQQHSEQMEVVAINDPSPAQMLAYLFKYDSTYGTCDLDVDHTEDTLIINGHSIAITHERDPKRIPWKKTKVDIVIECTGIFRTRESAGMHIIAGAKKVILSAPAKDPSIPTFVRGVNDHKYTSDMEIISNASCTTNCLAPVAKVLLETYGIQKGMLSTIHAYTSSQRLQDGSHRDMRRGRSATQSIIPTSTGATDAVSLVLPSLKSKLEGMAYRVPTNIVSLVDFTCILEKAPVDVNELVTTFEKYANEKLAGILRVSKIPLVSIDFKQDPYSSIIDSRSLQVNGDMVRIVAWYDNEWAYSVRLAELTSCVVKKWKDA